MNDIVNLMCVAIIAFIIFYLIFKDYKVCENFEDLKDEELVCNYAIDNRIIEFFEEIKENKYNEVKLNRILEYTESEENENILSEQIIIDKKNIYEVLTDSGYVTKETVKENGKDVVKYKVKDNKNIEINLEYIIKLLQKYQKEKDDNIIIKVVKNSEVFDEGIIDIGKVLVSSN